MVYDKKLFNAFKSTFLFAYSKVRHADLVISEATVDFNKMSQAGFFFKRYLFSISFCPSMKFRTLFRLSTHCNTWLHMESHGIVLTSTYTFQDVGLLILTNIA